MQSVAKTFLSIAIFSFFSSTILAQCPIPQTAFGNGTAPSPGNSVITETCNFVGEYVTVPGVVAGDNYSVNYSGGIGVYVVVYDTGSIPIAWADTTAQFTAAQSGTYYCAVFIDSSCNANDPNFTCNANLWTNNGPSAELQTVNASMVSAVPNPTKDRVTLSFEGNNADVLVSDLRGKMVHSGQVKSGDEIDLSSVDAGIYFFNVQIDGKSEIIQIVRE